MSTEANKATLRRMLYDVIVGGDLDLMDELVAPSFLNHNVVGTAEASHNEGIETFRQEIRAVRRAMPDIEIEIVHLLSDGDYVVAHVRSRGTQMGAFGDIGPTGRKIVADSMSIVRFANGKLSERWNLVDRFGMLQQLGVLPGQ